MISSSADASGVVAALVQFSVQGGGGGSCFPGKGTSPASVAEDRHRASRETAISLFMGLIPRAVNVRSGGSIAP